MIAGAPGHLHDNHGLGFRIGTDHFTGQPHHVHGSSQERRFSLHIVPDLADEVIAIDQLDIEARFLKNRRGLCLEITICQKRSDVTAPQDIWDFDRTTFGYRARFDRTEQIGERFLSHE